MLSLDLNAAKSNFFDRKKVTNAVDRMTRKVLSKFGAYVRRRAQTSMRTKKGASAPGKPPNAHGQRLLRKGILFAYEESAKSVVIGPILLSGKGKGEATWLNEHGGAALRQARFGQSRVVHYAARPYMRPAFEAELQKSMPGLFKDQLA